MQLGAMEALCWSLQPTLTMLNSFIGFPHAAMEHKVHSVLIIMMRSGKVRKLSFNVEKAARAVGGSAQTDKWPTRINIGFE